jgi:flagellar protein FlaG
MSNGAKVGLPAVGASVVNVQRPDAVARDEKQERSRAAAMPPAKPAPETVKAVAKQLDAYLRSVSRSLEFRVDAASGHTVVSVRDAQTGELIRQIPNEEVLRLAEMAHDQTVVLINETV